MHPPLVQAYCWFYTIFQESISIFQKTKIDKQAACILYWTKISPPRSVISKLMWPNSPHTSLLHGPAWSSTRPNPPRRPICARQREKRFWDQFWDVWGSWWRSRSEEERLESKHFWLIRWTIWYYLHSRGWSGKTTSGVTPLAYDGDSWDSWSALISHDPL